MTDRAWACPARTDDTALARFTRTYAFEFADRSAPPIYPRPESSTAGAVHGTDLPYLFDFSSAGVQLTPAQQRLSTAMIGSWTRFARTGTPGWPAFGRDPYVQGLDMAPLGVGRIDHSARHKCPFWATVG
jgi:para-nitrobenzyl esterase